MHELGGSRKETVSTEAHAIKAYMATDMSVAKQVKMEILHAIEIPVSMVVWMEVFDAIIREAWRRSGEWLS